MYLFALAALLGSLILGSIMVGLKAPACDGFQSM